MRMIDEARKQGVFISEDPQLLALLSRLDVDQEIPQELYTAVAVVLSWVYWLKGMRPGDEKTASDPLDPLVPPLEEVSG
jgi:flagellar biosynthesis protein